MAITIEKNVPIPGIWTRAGGVTATLRSMEVGDSFLAPQKQRSSMAQFAKRAGCRVVTRKEGDKVRVWKVAA
jgi:hypothetical protein